MIITPQMHKLAEQRQRHARYLRFLIREPQISGYHNDGWTPDEPGEPIEMSDPYHDYESRLRDLADEILDKDESATKQALEVFIADTEATDLGSAFLQREHLRLLSRLRGDPARDFGLRDSQATSNSLREACAAMHYAKILEDWNTEAD